MTRNQAEYLASLDTDYVARCIRGNWLVWSRAADHVVEFDDLPKRDVFTGKLIPSN